MQTQKTRNWSLDRAPENSVSPSLRMQAGYYYYGSRFSMKTGVSLASLVTKQKEVEHFNNDYFGV